LQAEQKGVAVRVDVVGNVPAICVDRERLTQVLNNLVANALRYTHKGEIVLSAGENAGMVTLRVQDSGVGISPDDLPHIFNRFYRADKSRHRQEDATSGLGLAIAHAIVEAHGGQISVESEVGKGTTFTIGLPVS
jgi:signal transduction histidine kinase